MFFDKYSLTWPPIPGLLAYYSNLSFVHSKPRENWTKDEWQNYAEFLERKGKDQNVMLFQVLSLLAKTKKKLSRKAAKVTPTPSGGLLSSFIKQKPKKGRKPGSKFEAPASAAISLREKCKISGKKITDRGAAKLVLIENGYSEWRADRDATAIAKKMTELRTKSGTNLRKPKKCKT